MYLYFEHLTILEFVDKYFKSEIKTKQDRLQFGFNDLKTWSYLIKLNTSIYKEYLIHYL